MKLNFRIIVYAILILLIASNIGGCSKKHQKDQPHKKPLGTEKSAVPKELTKIEEDIEKIMKQAKKINDISKNNTTSSKKTSQNKSEDDKNKKSSDKAEEKQEKPSPIEKNWNEIEKLIKDIHTNWNILTPIAVKAGSNLNLINSMSASINDITTISVKKTKLELLIAANNVYKYIPDLEDLFKVNTPTDLKRLKYYTLDINFRSETQNWGQIAKDFLDINSVWVLLKPKMPKEAKFGIDKFEAGLSELEKAIKSQNSIITKIKSDVLISDIKALEKDAKSKK
ncbi:MAG: hypothetical protein ACPLW7_00520 [Minisyncoccia bacterium]